MIIQTALSRATSFSLSNTWICVRPFHLGQTISEQSPFQMIQLSLPLACHTSRNPSNKHGFAHINTVLWHMNYQPTAITITKNWLTNDLWCISTCSRISYSKIQPNFQPSRSSSLTCKYQRCLEIHTHPLCCRTPSDHHAAWQRASMGT